MKFLKFFEGTGEIILFFFRAVLPIGGRQVNGSITSVFGRNPSRPCWVNMLRTSANFRPTLSFYKFVFKISSIHIVTYPYAM